MAVELSVSLVELEREKKPTVADFVKLRVQMDLPSESAVVALNIKANSRYYYGPDYWKSLFSGIVFHPTNLKISTSGLSTASLRQLLLVTKRLKD